MDMLKANREAEKGLHPVATGRATWLPKVYIDGVHFAASVLAEIDAENFEKAKNGR